MDSTKPQPKTTDPAPTLTDAEVLNRFQGLSASIALAGKRHGATMKPERDALRAELERRLAIAAARPAGVTPNYDAALAKWNEWEDENADLMRWDGDVRYQAMCAAVDAARATADAAAEGE